MQLSIVQYCGLHTLCSEAGPRTNVSVIKFRWFRLAISRSVYRYNLPAMSFSAGSATVFDAVVTLRDE